MTDLSVVTVSASCPWDWGRWVGATEGCKQHGCVNLGLAMNNRVGHSFLMFYLENSLLALYSLKGGCMGVASNEAREAVASLFWIMTHVSGVSHTPHTMCVRSDDRDRSHEPAYTLNAD